jgi:hypothetical protein
VAVTKDAVDHGLAILGGQLGGVANSVVDYVNLKALNLVEDISSFAAHFESPCVLAENVAAAPKVRFQNTMASRVPQLRSVHVFAMSVLSHCLEPRPLYLCRRLDSMSVNNNQRHFQAKGVTRRLPEFLRCFARIETSKLLAIENLTFHCDYNDSFKQCFSSSCSGFCYMQLRNSHVQQGKPCEFLGVIKVCPILATILRPSFLGSDKFPRLEIILEQAPLLPYFAGYTASFKQFLCQRTIQSQHNNDHEDNTAIRTIALNHSSSSTTDCWISPRQRSASRHR